MIRVRCPWTLHWEQHPALLAGMVHPSVEYALAQDVPADVEFIHTTPHRPAVDIPVVFHTEEVRTLFWSRETGPTLQGMPSLRQWLSARRRLESYSAIVTHLRMTVPALRSFLMSRRVGAITRHVPLGIDSQPDVERPRGRIRFLFTNSHHGHPANFRRRGGKEAIVAFRELRQIYPDAELVLVTPHSDQIEIPEWVTVIRRRVSEEELGHLFSTSDALLLPSVDLHAHSVIRAMSHGCIPIVSDAPGFAEYVTHGKTGLVARGRLGRQCWRLPLGLVQSTNSVRGTNKKVAANLYRVMRDLADSIELRRQIAFEAVRHVRANNRMEDWRNGLAAVMAEVAVQNRAPR